MVWHPRGNANFWEVPAQLPPDQVVMKPWPWPQVLPKALNDPPVAPSKQKSLLTSVERKSEFPVQSGPLKIVTWFKVA